MSTGNHTKSLCAFCDDFTQKLVAGVQRSTYASPPTPSDGDRFETAEWRDSMTIWHGVYKHHSSLAELIASAKEGCDLCRLLMDDFAHLAMGANDEVQEYCNGWLGFYFNGQEAYTTISGGLKSSGEVFRAGFSGSLDRMPPRKAPLNNPPLMYRVCEREGDGTRAHPPLRHPSIERRTARVIPKDGTASAVFDVANAWLTECVKDHAQCRERPMGATAEDEIGPLPTRVLDVDPGLGDRVRLHISDGKKAPYVALSHCWGGNIPNKTIRSTLDKLQHGISIASLPLNFQDAILITRKLNIQYIWIDALCIVQDDAADWAREADLMDEVYAYSTLTITGLDSPSSTAGILRRNRLSSVAIPSNPKYAIQACGDSLPVALGNCILSERAWCLQERFLAPRLLHFNNVQILWECRDAVAAEDDRPWDWEGSALAARNLVTLHRALGQAPKTPPTSENWCMLVEEYSTRRLTFGSDKLPAMIGTSQMFRAKNPKLEKYVAGLWSGDLARNLCWGPSLLAFNEDRRRPGYAGHDILAQFTRPDSDKPRAPSWSWAAVDGSLYFPCSRSLVKPWVGEVEILHVKMEDGEKGAAGTITLRGHMGVFDYEEPQPTPNVALGDVGMLRKPANNEEQQGEGSYNVAGSCVLDFDRHKPRKGCHVLLVASSDMPRAFATFLVLEKMTSGNFRRIGISTIFLPPFMRESFQKMVEGLEVQQVSIE